MNGEMMEYMVGRRGIPMDVLTRMKIEERLEFLPQTGKEEACICFPYLEDGVMKNMKFRDAAKHFKMVKGAELIPWNIDAIKGKEKCYITEGEIDALSLIAAGLEEVVSVPNGAGGANLQWLDRFVESHFDDKTEIILAMDTDRRGVELRDELVRRLGVDRCKVVAWGEGCKDANEYLLKYDLPRLRQQVEQAAEIPLEGVFCPMDEWDTLMDIYYNGMPEGADTGLENLDRLIKFERGFVLTVTGVPGSGKSEFVDEIAMRLLLRHDWKVGYFSPENTPLAYHYRKLIRRVVGKRFEHKGMPLPEAGQAIRYLAQSVFSIMPKEDFSVESVLRIAAQLVSRKGVKVLVVDPFNRFEHQIPDWETETQYISRIFDEFSNFAVKHKVLLILVAHPTKLRREPGSKRWPVPTLYDINGSAAFFNKTDYGMVVDRNDELGQVLVRVAKVRFDHLGGPGDAFFAFSTYNGYKYINQALELNEHDAEIRIAAGRFFTIEAQKSDISEEEQENNLRNAEHQFTRALEFTPKEERFDVLFKIGSLYFDEHNFEYANQYFELINKEFPEDADATYFFLAYGYYHQQESASFMHYLAKIRKEIPDMYATMGTGDTILMTDTYFNEALRAIKEDVSTGKINLNKYL